MSIARLMVGQYKQQLEGQTGPVHQAYEIEFGMNFEFLIFFMFCGNASAGLNDPTLHEKFNTMGLSPDSVAVFKNLWNYYGWKRTPAKDRKFKLNLYNILTY